MLSERELYDKLTMEYLINLNANAGMGFIIEDGKIVDFIIEDDFIIKCLKGE